MSVVTLLDEIDLGSTMARPEAEKRLDLLQRRLLHLRLYCAGLLEEPRIGPSLCVVFEGWDASGKGGAIKRLVAQLDPRHVAVHPFGAPSAEVAAHHFLQRFWEVLPARGGMAIFDRSWYGRVLVERVEGLASEDEWRRAYKEIVDFERSLVLEGSVVVKFWLHVSALEQLRRFEARAKDPLRRWKLTEEDWRNRARRSSYANAVEEMVKMTDHPHARWDLVAAESKHFARVRVLETVIERLESGMRRAGLTPPPSVGADYDQST
ncbi:MAG TPA: UDP-galactose-lipid carrier transferase [Acidimicrobiales bacterium]|nr:UDP-galactose-lipid carrier transferase [Acidimicrobiales bacterium]